VTRRTFLGAAAGAAAAARGQNNARPNILVIMADDMGFSDLGCYGGEIETPNLDRLAKSGVRFTQFYNAARCCPSRAALLTGLYSHQAGVGDMVRDLGRPEYQGYLNDRCVTLAEAVRPAGYRTYMAGKWHVGEDRPHWPTDRGFQRYFGLISGASNYFRLDEGRKMAIDDQPYVPDSDRFYMTDAFTDWSLKFLDEHAKDHAESPFLLYLAYTAPHWPLHAWTEDIAKYRGKYLKGWDQVRQERHAQQVEMGLVEKAWGLSPREARLPAWEDVAAKDRDLWDLRMAVYAAQIDRMDRGIGRVLDKLKEQGRDSNTIVLFLADNGGCHEEPNRGTPGVPPGHADSFMAYGRAWANASNTPFRMYKHWVHEGGIASPLIAHWPAAMKNGGGFDRDPAHITDIMATCLDAAGASYPESRNGRQIVPTEGRSMLPALRGGRRRFRETLFWEHEGGRAVRYRNWKLVAEHKAPWELYDLAADRCELKNRAAEQRGRVAQMVRMYEEWAARCGVVPYDDLRRRSA
jgi:arylsulfatase